MSTALPSSSTPKREDLRKKPLEYARRTRSPVKPSKPPRLRREATLQAGLAIEKSLLSIAESTPSTLTEGRFRTGIVMRPYQAEDAAKICEREADVRRPGYSGPIGFILGYHMGLGKTAVALHVAQSGGGSTLVVCPGGGLTDHWVREIAKFTDLRVFEAQGKYTKEDLEAADIVLISYSRLMRRYAKLVDYWEQQEEVARLSNLPLPDRRTPTEEQIAHLEELGCTVYLVLWDRIFGDEGHLMRNPEAKSLAAFHALLTWFVVIITATPAQNSLRDFYAYLRLLRVKYMNLEDLEHFDRHVTKPLSGTDKRLIANATQVLQHVLNIVQYRPPCTSDGRMLLRLPNKYRHDIVVTLNSVERAVYDYIIDYLLAKNLIGIYAALIRARQVCSQMQQLAGLLPPTSDIPADDEFLDSPPSVRDPPLDPDPTSDEMRASFDDLADLSIPTHLTSDRPLISAERFPSQLPQSVKDIFSDPEIPYTSSKFQAVYDILENRIPVEEKVIIFSHFARTLHMLAAGLEHRYGQYFDYTLYTGTMSREERRAALNCISSKRGPRPCRVILVSIGAGGSGLNITACNHVILMEPWWNPYVEEQAISRAYRSGQNRNVHTYHLVVQDSIEENIVTRQTEKRTIIGNFMSLCAIPDVPEMHDWIKLTRWKLRDVE